MRIIFVGTSSLAVPILEGLMETQDHQLLGIVTQPDRSGGRGLKQIPSPVKKLVTKHHYPLYQPANINDPSPACRPACPADAGRSIGAGRFVDTLKTLSPEAVVVAAYGQKISAPLLTIPRYGWINIHPSLLPKYRGASPVPHAIRNGDTITGVTIIKMVSKMDAGPIMAQQSLDIQPDETTPELEIRLAQLGARMLLETLSRLDAEQIELKEQPEEGVTFAPRLKKIDGLINWNNEAFIVYNHIRAMQPWPGAYTFLRPASLQINIIRASMGLKESAEEVPGTIIAATRRRLLVNTGQGAIYIETLKPAGRSTMTATDFINGYRVKKGDHFGNH